MNRNLSQPPLMKASLQVSDTLEDTIICLQGPSVEHCVWSGGSTVNTGIKSL